MKKNNFLSSLFRKGLCLIAFFALFLCGNKASAQGGTSMYDAIPIQGGCGSTSFNDYKNNSSSFSNNFGNSSPDIWYTFTLASQAQVNISLCGSSFDTYLYILDQSGNTLVYNDDNGPLCAGTNSSVSQNLGAGTYYIVAEGFSTYTGDIAVSVNIAGTGSALGGSNLYNAINAGTFGSVGNFTDVQDNSNPCFGNDIGQPSNDIYYFFNLSSTATVTLSHCGSTFDTYMHLLDASGNEIASNDDNYSSPCPGAQAYIQMVLPAGSYYLVSEGYGNNSGSLVSSISVSGGGGAGIPVFSYPIPSVLAMGSVVNFSPVHTGGAVSSEAVAVTFAGSGAGLYNPLGTATDAQGNVFVADGDNHIIRKISPAGVVSTLAGAGYAGYADGVGTSAVFQHPSALVVDANGNVFVSDQQNHRIRKISPNGVVSTFAGSGVAGSSNGTGSAASFNSPIGLALDALGNLYVADYGNHKIRMITPAGLVSNYAGTGTAGMANGAASAATFRNPMGLAFDASGILYVADRLNHCIRKISSGVVSTIAGNGSTGALNGTGSSATFNYPNGVAVDAVGNIYVADQLNNMVRKVNPLGAVTTLAGTTTAGSTNGSGPAIRLTSPYGLSIDTHGNIYVAENSTNMIRKISTSSYSVVPELPVGLTLDPITGVISGTPTALTANANYTVTAYNSSGSGSTSFSFSIGGGCISASTDQNYLITYVPRFEGMTTQAAVVAAACDQNMVQTGIQYFDGLGRAVQNIQVKGSPLGGDLVQPVAYDNNGRESVKYLPYAATSNGGAFRTDALSPGLGQSYFYNSNQPGVQNNSFPFAVTLYEPSPLGAINEKGAPGAIWQPGDPTIIGSGHTLKINQSTNNSDDSYSATGYAVRIFRADMVSDPGQEHKTVLSSPGFYAKDQLNLTVSKDENWQSGNGKVGTVEEYKDNQGHVVLKRHFNLKASVIEVISIYYVYDDLGNLCYVLPAAVQPDNGVPDQSGLDNFCYQYRYDGRKRLIEKRIPGKGWEFMVYNNLDQLVFTQDANLHSLGQWLFTKYDVFGRTIITGLYDSNAERSDLQLLVDNHAVKSEQPISTGIGYTNNALPQVINYYHSINYYDTYNFPGNSFGGATGNQVDGDRIRTLLTGSKITVLGTGTMLLTVNYYDLEGRLVQQKSEDHMTGHDVVDNTYDFLAELRYNVRTHTLGAVQTGILSEYRYDHMGRKTESFQQINTNGITGQNVMLSKSIYNEVGQLVQKQLNDGLQHTDFTYNQRGWLKSSNSNEFSVQLKYEDGTIPQYNGNITSQVYVNGISNSFEYKYDNLNRLLKSTAGNGLGEDISYDLMGNISSLTRDGFGTNSYNSYTGNRLNSISGFTNSNYAYDDNGNLSSDTQKRITHIEYNYLNLPRVISGSQSITYTYDAAGTKLHKQSSVTGDRDYVDGIEYVGGSIDIIHNEDGIARNQNGNYSYEYSLPDHLGNVRASFYKNPNTQASEILQRDDYYAFGLRKEPGTVVSSNDNKYLYNGKELQEELKEYDYGARFYDPVIARWNVIDPKAEADRKTTPYAYAFNNPINATDPDGMFAEYRSWDGIFHGEDGKDEEEEFEKHLSGAQLHTPFWNHENVDRSPEGAAHDDFDDEATMANSYIAGGGDPKPKPKPKPKLVYGEGVLLGGGLGVLGTGLEISGGFFGVGPWKTPFLSLAVPQTGGKGKSGFPFYFNASVSGQFLAGVSKTGSFNLAGYGEGYGGGIGPVSGSYMTDNVKKPTYQIVGLGTGAGAKFTGGKTASITWVSPLKIYVHMVGLVLISDFRGKMK